MVRWLPLLFFPLIGLVPLSAGNPKEAKAFPTKGLDDFIARDIEAKKIPALSIALVDDQKVLWSKGFGFQDPAAKTPATAGTLHRVGSVSKPFTALLLMLFVELGLIDLDVPVQRYLPDFTPKNTSGKDITLRQMLAHRSGLVRESPVGNYFDESGPTLAQTVASINKTEMVYVPAAKTSYSNAALATVGYLLEKTQKEDYVKLIQRKLLDPIGMTDSSYDPSPELRKRLAKATMWSYHGRTFPAPTFDLGMAPAGSLYSTADDMAKFLKFLFAGGKTQDGKQLLKRATLESMYKIQFPDKDEKASFGLGFFVSEFEGKKRIGHGGAVYGFATAFAALPEDKLGVIVIASKDVANAVTGRIADVALRHLLAYRQGKPPPAFDDIKDPSREEARRLAGRYQAKDKFFDLVESDGRLWSFPGKGGMRVEVRNLGKDLITDGPLGFGTKIVRAGDQLKIGADAYQRVATPSPKPLPDKWRGLIGEYGPDHNVLFILEKDGKLFTLIEWVFLYPLEEVTADVYKFPDYGLYQGDKVVFQRDKQGRAVAVEAAAVPFTRRSIRGEEGTFKIEPVRPVAELRKAALAAKPPEEKNAFFKKPDLVDLTTLDPTIKLDIRYATDNNFLGTPVYTSAKAYLQRPAAESLARAHKKLAKDSFGLMIHDAYRPWYVTKIFRDATPAKWHHFVADPMQGSRHNRGCAVDLTLYDLKTGKAVEMVSGYDEFSDRSYADYLGGTSAQRQCRDLLRRSMEAEGFAVYETEWWHFDFHAWRQYPILNQTFEELQRP